MSATPEVGIATSDLYLLLQQLFYTMAQPAHNGPGPWTGSVLTGSSSLAHSPLPTQQLQLYTRMFCGGWPEISPFIY